ncbi:hypothetical protein CFBP498_43770 [Xanthomonas hortorum pv. vitians]|uniref:Uncharacterized protein n=1 Tax=Xanthomonas hortorum pv. vitians TaxID=83224 RepID=A0A6V7F8C9_9XANT|nr:hypothetical protein CFBP498_43770 [Xanthomonas hortorum pv. vitians]CAD0359738.1 hypothetical protein CFBP498_43770 [Xanthomonas hortorum pv. vitians]
MNALAGLLIHGQKGETQLEDCGVCSSFNLGYQAFVKSTCH